MSPIFLCLANLSTPLYHRCLFTSAALFIQMAGGAELSALSKSIKLEIDQATVSLVDKDLMRSKVGYI